MSVLSKLQKNSTIKETAILSESKFFNKKDMIPTSIPVINIALSGRLDGGLTPGLTMWAGPSKHFKTAFSLLMAKAYLEKYEDAALLFYDSEFGTPQSYFDTAVRWIIILLVSVFDPLAIVMIIAGNVGLNQRKTVKPLTEKEIMKDVDIDLSDHGRVGHNLT